MVSGRCAETADWEKITPSKENLLDLYIKIYKFNIRKGIQTLRQIEKEGISPYAGGHPCNQLACGFYITLGGIILRCPGDDITVFGDIRTKSLNDIWINCENYKRAGIFNYSCPPKIGKSIPEGFFKEVLEHLRNLKNYDY